MDFLSKFNDIFQDMIRDLINVFPNDSELRLYEFGLKATIASDKYVVSRIFNENVAIPYGEQIKKNDESFFLNKSYEEFGNSAGDIIGKLKKCWAELDDDNKNIIWKYLRVLVGLNQKIYC